MQRVAVIGTSGSGKSTVARAIAGRLGLPLIASDDFWWEPGWTPAPPDVVARRVAEAVAQDAWVLESNFDPWRHLVWRRADLVVWLDYPRGTVLRGVALRNLRWALRRSVVWAGNSMTVRRAFSGVRHAMDSFGPKRRLYPGWFDELEIAPVRLRSRKACDRWLRSLPSRGWP